MLGRVGVINSRLSQRADDAWAARNPLTATERYVKLLPQPEERSPADRLNAYVARAAGRAGW